MYGIDKEVASLIEKCFPRRFPCFLKNLISRKKLKPIGGLFIMKEIWKDITGYEGRYKVSNTGKVKSLPKLKGSGKGYYTKEKILNPKIDKYGYKAVCLRKDNKNHYFTVHRLVALEFCNNPNGYNVVNHIDCNKLNDVYTNLEWCTVKENTIHAYKNNLFSPPPNGGHPKEVIIKNRLNNELIKFSSINECGRKLKVASKYISNKKLPKRLNNYEIVKVG